MALATLLPASRAIGAALSPGEPSAVGPQALGSGSGYELSWSTIDDGGAMSSAGSGYALSGTIGQPDAGAMGGGSYVYVGGFWVGWTGYSVAGYTLYFPTLFR